MSHLAVYLKQERLRWRMTLGQMAALLGYANLSKGARRIMEFERTGVATPLDLPLRMAEILGVESATVKALIQRDYADWQAWLNEPVPMRLVIRIMAGVCAEVRLPSSVATTEEAEAYARQFAKAHRVKACLAISRRVSVWIDECGEVVERTEAQPHYSNVPYMQIGGRRFLIDGDSAS